MFLIEFEVKVDGERDSWIHYELIWFPRLQILNFKLILWTYALTVERGQ